jgi:RNA polymerase sigma-70 factor (family 1)
MNSLSNEKQLLFQLSQGNKDAFGKIYDFYCPKIYYKLLKVLKSEFNVQEVLQDVFLKIWDYREKIDLEKSFGSYLSCIAANCCYDFFRKINRDKKLRTQFLKFFATKYSHIEESFVDRENSELLNQAINCLPKRRRQIFMLCKFDGKSYNQVSQQLGISTSTISDHIVKANHFIKTYFVRTII